MIGLWKDRSEKISLIGKTLSGEIRTKIALLLYEEECMSISQIAETIGESLGLVSHHVGIMKDRGMVIEEESGREHLISLSPLLYWSIRGLVRAVVEEEEIAEIEEEERGDEVE